MLERRNTIRPNTTNANRTQDSAAELIAFVKDEAAKLAGAYAPRQAYAFA